MVKFFLILIFTFIPLLSYGATYYVCPVANVAAASDSNAGTDPLAPWASAQKADPDTTTLSSGDTVYFCNQGTWDSVTENVFTQHAHILTVQSGVTYDGRTWGTGAGRAKFLATAANPGPSGNPDKHAMVAFYHYNESTGLYTGYSNVTFKGFDIDFNSCGTIGLDLGLYLKQSQAISNITIDDIEAHGMTNGGCSGNIWPYAISVSASTSGSVDGVTIKNSSSHDNYNGGINVYVKWDSAPMGHVQNVTIRNVSIYNITGGGIDIRNHVDNAVVEFSTIYNCTKGIDIGNSPRSELANGTDSPEDITVRYNIIYNNRESGIYLMNYQDVYMSGDIYGNIIYNNGSNAAQDNYDINFHNSGGDAYGDLAGWGDSVFNIYNNTFYNTRSTNGFTGVYKSILCIGDVPTYTMTDLTVNVVNNIFYSTSIEPIYDKFGYIGTHSNNLIYAPLVTNLVTSPDDTNYTSANLTSWEATAQTTDPTFTTGTLPTSFTGTYASNMAPNTDYFAISSGNAINNGYTLGTPYNGCINTAGYANGGLRPVGAYDIGAYEYGASLGVSSVTGCTISGASMQ